MQHDHDIRSDIFSTIMTKTVDGSIVADDAGIIAGMDDAIAQAESLGLAVSSHVEGGKQVTAGHSILSIRGNPMQIAQAEDRLIGCLAKPSGVASAARQFVDAAAGRLTIVAGAWKKMPIALKPAIRGAAEMSGAQSRISLEPFLYLDKNYTRMFGGIAATLQAVQAMENLVRVIQVCGQHREIGAEAEEAARHGANIVFVDTGDIGDLHRVSDQLHRQHLRETVQLAFGGGIKREMIEALAGTDVDLVDIGRSIVDAPLLDMHLNIVDISEPPE